MILILSYQKDEFKMEIINNSFILGFTPLFEQYSKDDFYDSEMVLILLKCMANFCLINKAKDQMLKRKIIVILGNFLVSQN